MGEGQAPRRARGWLRGLSAGTTWLAGLGLASGCGTNEDEGEAGAGGRRGAFGGTAAAPALLPASSPTPTYDATYCVRPPGATYGAGDGTSWDAAFSGLPPALERGARYLISAGDFRDPGGPRALEDPLDGEAFIGIERATADDHGPELGWEADFGVGAAELGALSVVTGHYVIDGKLGAGTAGYGFTLTADDCGAANAYVVSFPYDSTATDVVLRHLELAHCGNRGYDGPSHDTVYSVRPLERIWIERSYLHDANRVHLLMVGWSDVVVEGCYFARNGNAQESHTVVANEVRGLTLRGNVLQDSPSVFVVLDHAEDVTISANLFLLTFDDGRGIYASVDGRGTNTNVTVAGNTFYAIDGLNAGIRFDESATGIEVTNNLWAGCRTNQIMLSGAHDHNAFWDNVRIEGGEQPLDERIEDDDKQVLTASPFVDPAALDLRLREPTAAGRSLAAPFDVDLLGQARGTDGCWDRGAYEYAGE